LRIGGVDVDLTLPPNRANTLTRIERIGFDERRPKVVSDAAYHVQFPQAVERRILALVGVVEQLIERVLSARLDKLPGKVARERVLIWIRPVHDRRTNLLARVELPRCVTLLEQRIVLLPCQEPQDLDRQT